MSRLLLSPLPAAHHSTTGSISWVCSSFTCPKSWGRASSPKGLTPASPVWDICCGWGGAAPAPRGHSPFSVARSRNGWRCQGIFPRVLLPPQPRSALPSSRCTPVITFPSSSQPLPLTCFIYYFHRLLFPCCFCTDLFPFHLLPPSVYSPLHSCPSPSPSRCSSPSSSTNPVSAAAAHLSGSDGSPRGARVPRVGEENFPVLLPRVGNMEAVTHFLSCPMMCRSIIYPFYWARSRAEE